MIDFGIIPTAEASVVTLMKSIDRVIINPIIFFLFALAMVYFLYGVAQYFLSPDNEEVRKNSKSVMLWGIVGLFVMVAVFGIMRLILNTVGTSNKVVIQTNGDYAINDQQSYTLATKNPEDYTIKQGELAGDSSTVADVSIGAKDGITDSSVIEAVSSYTTTPFKQKYIEAPKLCWHEDVMNKGATEYLALKGIQGVARSAMLKTTGLNSTQVDLRLPVPYHNQTLYDKKAKLYYVWWDARGPIGAGTMKDCDLKIDPTQGAVVDTAGGASNKDLSTMNNGLTNTEANSKKPIVYTDSPFPVYVDKPTVCWHKDIYVADGTEYNAKSFIQAEARKQLLSDTKLANDKIDARFPIPYAVQSLYDAKNKLYYYWWDARAPIGKGTATDCKLALKKVLPKIESESTKTSYLVGKYVSDTKYYRIVGSGVDKNQSSARAIALQNALVTLAQLKSLDSIDSLINTVKIVDESYYSPTEGTATGNYDYFVAIELKK